MSTTISNDKILPIFTLLLILLSPFAYSQNADQSTILIDSTKQNGSFEDGTKDWRVSRVFQAKDPVFEQRKSTAEVKAYEGEYYLAVGMTNEPDSNGDIQIKHLTRRGLDLKKGKLFRLIYAVQNSKQKNMQNQVVASITFGFNKQSGKKPQTIRDRFTLEKKDGWQVRTFDAIYDGDVEDQINSITVDLGFSGKNSQVVASQEAYVDGIKLEQLPAPKIHREGEELDNALGAARAELGIREEGNKELPKPVPPIPITFNLPKAGYATLVIEDEKGQRVRNLFSGMKFAAGEHTVNWDGLGEGRIKITARAPGYEIQRNVVDPGKYRVRGLVRDEIKLIYEFTIYPNISDHPCKTDSGEQEGGWLGDHGNPTATLFIPAKIAPGSKDQVLLANSVNESGHGLAWVDLQGKKIKGQRNLGGTWTGASHLERDKGPNANPLVYAYARMDWNSKVEGKTQIRMTGLTKQGDVVIATPDEANSWDGGNPGDLAVYNGLLIYSTLGPNKLTFYDVRNLSFKQEAKRLGQMDYEKPEAMEFDAQGRLLIAGKNRLLRYTIKEMPWDQKPENFKISLSKPEVLTEGLDEPRNMTIDDDGLIYIAEWGKSHQIKVFDDKGKLVRTIGKPGGPKVGPYDPEKMAFPYGMSVDSQGQLWVAQRRWWTPKVIYVWTKEGKHIRNHYGPAGYGGGGFFDPQDPTRFLYHDGSGGLEFKVDWQAGKAEPVAIYDLPVGPVNDKFSERTELFRFRGNLPMFPYRAKGHQYITNRFSGGLSTNGPGILLILSDDSPDKRQPMMMIGKVGTYEDQLKKLGLWDNLDFNKHQHLGQKFSGAQKTIFVWTDNNRDGQVQADEFQFHLPKILLGKGNLKYKGLTDYASGTGITTTIELGPDLEIYIGFSSRRADDSPGGIMRLRPDKVDADGMPHYDLTKFEVAGRDAAQRLYECSDTLYVDKDHIISTGGPIYGYENGQVKWLYHSQWPGLHSGHAGPRAPQFSGQLIATTKPLGAAFTPQAGEAGPLWALNSNLGLAYLFTTDGLLVDTLFEYRNTGGKLWNFYEHHRGMDLSNVNYIDECFNPTIQMFDDGRVFMVVGKNHSSVVEVKGLESIKRFTGNPISITTEDIARIKQYDKDLATWEQAQKKGELLFVRKATQPITIDGDFKDWGKPAWVVVQRERVSAGFGGRDVDYTSAAVSYDKDNLYVALSTRLSKNLINAGKDIKYLFSTGGGIDIHLATEKDAKGRKQAAAGDVRLLISEVDKGKYLAARYRPVVPGTKEPFNYHSSVASTDMDSIDDVSKDIRVAQKKTSIMERQKKVAIEQIEVAIPLSLLGWNPANKHLVQGDIGILVGDNGATIERIYWYNKATGIVSDLPSEARLYPSMWGPWKVEK